jgi:3-deoxy-D-manno-octulosonic-acid transferase
MQFLYDVLIRIAAALVWASQFFSGGMKRFVTGRKSTLSRLQECIEAGDRPIWFHCASLGEFEQGVPIIEGLRTSYPERKLVVSFFSPSGYEIKKHTPLADVVVYLPLDTPQRANTFLDALHPSLAVFVKYEIWPNYLKALQERNIHTLLVSGLFRESQIYFKWYGQFMRNALLKFHHIFVQDRASQMLLNSEGIKPVTVSGDTRFDRVSRQLEQDNHLPFMETFLAQENGESYLCLVCGSTWASDEAVLLPYIQSAPNRVKVVIAPHKVEASKIAQLKSKIKKSCVSYSELPDASLAQAEVLIIDTIGLLGKVYSYADIAYVGGAMGSTGLHNILEPATFGVPIIIGKNFNEFPEAKQLRQLAGLFTIENANELEKLMHRLVTDSNFRHQTGKISGHFVNQNTGATKVTLAYIDRLRLEN